MKRDATARAWKSWAWSSRRLQQGSPSQDKELGPTSQQEPVALPTDHTHVHTATRVESFSGPLVRFPRGRKLASYLKKKNPQTKNTRRVANAIPRKVRVQHHHSTAHRLHFSTSTAAELQLQPNGVEVLPDTIPRTLQPQTQN